jgi:hypothetical protein
MLMAQLNKIRLGEVYSTLQTSFFTAAGYSVVTPDSGKVIIHIELKDYSEYFIELRHETLVGGALAMASQLGSSVPKRELVVLESPSDYLSADQISVDNFGDFLSRLDGWVNRVKREVLMRDGVQQQLFKFRDELNATIEEHIQDPNAHFSPEEREDLHRRLKELEERVAANNQLSKDEIDRIRQWIRDMEKGAETMTKRSWVRTFVSNAVSGGLRFVAKGSMRLVLVGHLSKSLPSNARPNGNRFDKRLTRGTAP